MKSLGLILVVLFALMPIQASAQTQIWDFSPPVTGIWLQGILQLDATPGLESVWGFTSGFSLYHMDSSSPYLTYSDPDYNGLPTVGYPARLYAGDFDGDGHIELVIGHRFFPLDPSNSSAGLGLQLYDTTTGTIDNSLPPPSSTSRLRVIGAINWMDEPLGDVNGDGTPDMVVECDDCPTYRCEVVLWKRIYTFGGSPSAVLPELEQGNNNLQLNFVPNPLLGAGNIRYVLLSSTNISLRIFDVSGRLVQTLVQNEPRLQGFHELPFRPSFPTGVYFLRLETKSQVASTKFVIP